MAPTAAAQLLAPRAVTALLAIFFFFSSRRRHTRCLSDWSSDVCSSDLTRLNPADGNVIDLLPKGTVLSIRVLDAIDSDVTRDGAQFRGLVVAPVVSKDEVVIHADAAVRGLFALLRSRNHPDGFRYELLITGITDGGKLF